MQNRFHDALTADNATLLLVDHQIGLFTGVRDITVGELTHNVTCLAKAATRLGLPIVVTTTAADSMWGPLIPQLRAVLPEGLQVIDRSTVNAWHDDRVRNAVEATGRGRILIAGVSLEVCAAFPAIAATAAGYTAYVAVDASGTFSATKRETGLLRLQQAGVIVSDYATLAVEMLADNAHPAAGDLYADLDMPFAALVGQLAAAYSR
ncbi:isochorismatase family protein [Planomonospora sp. ID67723]|uniref:isochorismatase family protein n=1 Tax=Planomonospora sp. ID67723 TaxID=2738134 RepID=UPI0018C3F02E|nr:isochorismatase family protein [Planomonospora sp. ID67723]MBG0829000.1 isochorismatase family protein [Planomonospora sp. ID67723]